MQGKRQSPVPLGIGFSPFDMIDFLVRLFYPGNGGEGVPSLRGKKLKFSDVEKINNYIFAGNVQFFKRGLFLYCF